MDLTTDSEWFYNTILELLDDLDKKDEVDQLMIRWNWYAPSFLQQQVLMIPIAKCFPCMLMLNACPWGTVPWLGFIKSVQRSGTEWMLRLCEAITPGDVPAFNTCSHTSVKWNIWFYYLYNPGFCHIAWMLHVLCVLNIWEAFKQWILVGM